AWIARLQAAGARGLHPGIRAGGPATPTSDAARAGATTIIALTIKLDPSVGADQRGTISLALLALVGERHVVLCLPRRRDAEVKCSAQGDCGSGHAGPPCAAASSGDNTAIPNGRKCFVLRVTMTSS